MSESNSDNCKECGKPLDKGSAKGLCKKCYHAAYYKKLVSTEAGREKERAARKKAARKLRLEVLEHLGGKCECCGIGMGQWEFLSVDHIHGDGAKHRKLWTKGGMNAIYRDVRKQGYPRDKFRVLCYNCNFTRGHYGYCPHEREKK